MTKAICPDCEGDKLQITVLTKTTFHLRRIKEEEHSRWPVHGKLLLTEPESSDVGDDEVNCPDCGAMYSFDELIESYAQGDE